MNTTSPRSYTLRDLPIQAKLVVTMFLLSVCFGYFFALMQIHFQHGEGDGKPMPEVESIIERFSGLKKPDGKEPKSKIEELISGDREGALTKQNMAPAIFGCGEKGPTDAILKEIQKRGKEVVFEERESERKAIIAWIRSEPELRKKSYEDDKLPLPEALNGKKFTEEYLEAGQVKISSIIDKRCLSCHGGDRKPDLDSYDKMVPLITTPAKDELIGGKWVRSGKQLTLEKLTQSTHAHLLSFSVLFSLTGLVFAFSGLPKKITCIVAPMTLIAQICDICCWWLAREPVPYGPMFAMAIMATGGLVALGLGLQVSLSLLCMYSNKGRVVLALIVLALLGSGGAAVIAPRVLDHLKLEEQKNAAKLAAQNEPPKK